MTLDDAVAIHAHVSHDQELQGLAGGKHLDGALGRVENRLNYWRITDFFELGDSSAAAIFRRIASMTVTSARPSR